MTCWHMKGTSRVRGTAYKPQKPPLKNIMGWAGAYWAGRCISCQKNPWSVRVSCDCWQQPTMSLVFHATHMHPSCYKGGVAHGGHLHIKKNALKVRHTGTQIRTRTQHTRECMLSLSLSLSLSHTHTHTHTHIFTCEHTQAHMHTLAQTH
jgi:hypothetical protein